MNDAQTELRDKFDLQMGNSSVLWQKFVLKHDRKANPSHPNAS